MNAFKGDLFTTPGRPYESDEEAISNDKAHVMDLVLPVAVLIVSCIVAMIYTGGFLTVLPLWMPLRIQMHRSALFWVVPWHLYLRLFIS